MEMSFAGAVGRETIGKNMMPETKERQLKQNVNWQSDGGGEQSGG